MHHEKRTRWSALAAVVLLLILVPSAFAEVRTTKFTVEGLS